MKANEIIYEWIDRYLNGQLEGEELSAFTHKLESDAEFSTLVENQKAANVIILGNRLAIVKQMMDADFKSTGNKNTAAKWGLGGLLGASVLIGSLLYFSDSTTPVPSSSTNFTYPIETQKQSSNTQSPEPDKEIPGRTYQPLDKKIDTSAAIDTVNVKTFSTGIIEHSDFATNPVSKLSNGSINPVNIDSIQVKNQLPGSNKNILKPDICLDVVIEGILRVDAACTYASDGEIHIIENSMKGGLSPYTYVLINKTNDTVRQKTTSFVSLAKGQYKLLFEDANNCLTVYKKPLYVNEKSCTQRTQSFSPHAGEQFSYPVSGVSDAQITIYNRGGQNVYKTNLSKGESGLWDETNQNGQLLPTGMYIYIIEYVSGIKETGEVVIF